MSESSSFGRTLRELRLATGLTLESLAARSFVGERTISDIERGVSVMPRRSTVDALASGLGLDDAQAQAFLRAARAGRKTRSAERPESALVPNRVNDFTGRETEVATVLQILRARVGAGSVARSVVIAGAPGTGKTTVAWEALSREADRWESILFLNLDGFGPLPLTQLQVLSSLLRQMPGYETKVPSTVSEAVKMWRVATDRHPVGVLLDNAAAENQVRPVLGIDSRNAIVVTSRRSLSGLECGGRVLLGPLLRRESVALLQQLIPERQRDELSLNGLAGICDDIPLALRIAGNRIASRPGWCAADYLYRLRSTENRLRLLVAGDLAIETAFALSYDNMDPATARLFRAISVVEGGPFDARLAAAIEGDDVDDTESRLDDLTDLGVLEARGANRYLLHDLLRLFALERLRAETGAAGVIERRNRLRRWLLHTLERAGAWFEPDRDAGPADGDCRFLGADEAAHWIKTEAEHWWPAMQKAASLGDHAAVVDAADSLHWFSDVWLQWGNWFSLFSLAAASARARGDIVMEATHLGYVAWAEITELGDHEAAGKTAEAALRSAIAAGDARQRVWANVYIAWSFEGRGRLDAALPPAREAVSAFNEAGDIDGAGIATTLIAHITQKQGSLQTTIVEMTAFLRDFPVPSEVTLSASAVLFQAHRTLAFAFLELRQTAEAVAAASRALEIATTMKDRYRTSVALNLRRKARAMAGHREAADEDRAEALRILDSAEYGSADAHVLDDLRRELAVADSA
jgi:transcriptional regulator with XRE-family HTH domain/tetratricopeptide (TPR) repeat protein